MANVLLGVTGSVAAIRTPELFRALKAERHDVRVVATTASLYFFDPAELDPSHAGRNPAIVTLDADEWPGAGYHRGDPVLHIELRRWAELFVIAPLDANTLAKLAAGLADNCLTCVWRAWDVSHPVLLCPAMNTLMWEHPLTARQLGQVSSDNPKARIVGPITKGLACGDVGIGAMAEVAEIVAAVNAAAESRK
jgi:phosphopantothenoylcysteine decarboxylase